MPNKELLDYYIKHTDERFKEVNKKLDMLISFRWLLIGAAAGVSGIVSVVFQLLTAFNKK